MDRRIKIRYATPTCDVNGTVLHEPVEVTPRPSPEVAPMQDERTIVIRDGKVSSVPAVAPRETQTETDMLLETMIAMGHPAAAPTPVEPKTTFGRWMDAIDARHPAAPAESQGVERAQPVEPAQCPKCKTWHDSADSVSYCLCNAPDDYRVTVDASYLKSLLRRPAAPVEGVERVTEVAPGEYERVTDNRTADTIRSKPYNSADELARSVEELLAENARAETRIEVLEAALLDAREAYDDAAELIAGGNIYLALKKLDGAFAALAAPSGETTT